MISGIAQPLILFILFIGKFMHSYFSEYKKCADLRKTTPLQKRHPFYESDTLYSGSLKLYQIASLVFKEPQSGKLILIIPKTV